MGIVLDEASLARELSVLLTDPGFERGVAQLTCDPFFLAFFLVSVSQGEGLGEAAVAMIGQEEIAGRIRDLRRQEEEERGHKERTIDTARELFPHYFDGERYRYAAALEGRAYYVAVLEANRDRLKRRSRYSRLNLYFTTTFAYEVMVMLLYGAVAAAVAGSWLPGRVRRRVGAVLDGILAEEATHLDVIDQHNALLEGPRESLSDNARRMLEELALLEAEDYRAPAELAVCEIVAKTRLYADGERYRAVIEASA